MLETSLLERIYTTMYTIRVFETRCIGLYRAGDIRGYFHPYLGEEAIASGVCAALSPRDAVLSTHRGHGHCIARGMSLDRMAAELLGKETGYCRGRGGSMHIADPGTGNLGANGIVGGGIPMAVGVGLAFLQRGEGRVVAVFFSDGAANNGVFAESLNLAAVWCLPVLFVLENNQYAATTPVERTSRSPSLHGRAVAYGIDSSEVDGNDAELVYQAAARAVAKCRAGSGPVLIEAVTYRQMGHHVNDPGTCMPADRLAYYRSRDPVLSLRAHLVRSTAEEAVQAIERAVEQDMEAAIAFAKTSPAPDVAQFVSDVGRYA